MKRKRKMKDVGKDAVNAPALDKTRKNEAAHVDPECREKLGSAHVYCEDDAIWDAMLNQTNIQFNNNKYYKMQILEDDDGGNYSLWFHWGRVGKTGQKKLNPCHCDLEKAKALFEQKFLDKTKNVWMERDNFEKVDGKYDLVKIDYEVSSQVMEKRRKKSAPVQSKLDPVLQVLMELIFNTKAMEEALSGMEFDIKRTPLGNLTYEQVLAGYAALKVIEDLVVKKQAAGRKILQACNDFYTRIPHYFGMRRPPLISTLQEIKDKLQLLDVLGDIQAAMEILGEEATDNRNPVDLHYESLHCKLVPLDSSTSDYKVIEDYLLCTHAESHQRYTMKLEAVFECDRVGEKKRFKDIGNNMLLWHGSRVTNYAGILSHGLRIAPPEAPVTGYMFGKGIYFADMSSKSANYCYTNKKNHTGLLLLSEVSLGKQEKLLAAKYDADKLPSGKHSVMGLGQFASDGSKLQTLSDGTIIPMGKEAETGVNNPNGYTLQYNEYIVYSPNQVLQYLKYFPA